MKLSFNNFREQPIAVRARDVEFVREKKTRVFNVLKNIWRKNNHEELQRRGFTEKVSNCFIDTHDSFKILLLKDLQFLFIHGNNMSLKKVHFVHFKQYLQFSQKSWLFLVKLDESFGELVI